MNPLNYIFVLIIIFIGIKASISDLKSYKIKNNNILYGFLLGILAYLTLIAIELFSNKNLINYEYKLQLVINLIISILIGIGFWLIKFWSAADAKLFILFAFLIPINFYQNGGIPIFFAFSIMINTFIVLVIYTIYSIIKNNKIKLIKEVKFSDLKQILSFQIIGIFFIIHWILTIILKFLPNNLFILISSFTFLFAYPLFKFLPKYKHFLLILVLVRLIFDSSIYSSKFIIEFITILLIFTTIAFLIKLIEIIFTKQINISELEVGMILKYPIVKKEKKYYQLTKENTNQLFKPQKNLGQKTKLEIIIPKKTRGLNISEYKKIKAIYQKKLIEKKILIAEHSSFAIYLFLGTIITLAAKGTLIYWILKLFQ